MIRGFHRGLAFAAVAMLAVPIARDAAAQGTPQAAVMFRQNDRNNDDRLSQQEDDDWQFQAGVEFATAQVQELIDGGVPGIHFYVLNKSQATSGVLRSVTLPE